MEIPFRGRTYAWASGGTINYDLSFMDAALAAFKAPVIKRAELRFRMTVSTGTSGGPGWLLAQLADKIVLNDQAGERLNASSRECAIYAQQELGNGFEQPRSVTASQSGVVVEFVLPLLPVDKCVRPEDFFLEVPAIRNGRLDIYLRAGTTLGGAQEFTALTSGEIDLMILVDNDPAGIPESKSRHCFRSFNLALAEDYYQINGVLRGIGYYAGTTDETAETLLAEQTITSYTLNFNSIPPTFFAEKYRRESKPNKNVESCFIASPQTFGDDVVLSDHVATPNFKLTPRYFCPVFASARDQKTTDLPIVTTVHLKLDSGTLPTNGKVLASYIAQRDVNQAVTVLKAGSVQQLSDDLAKSGVIKGWRGSRPLGSVDPRYRAALPIKVK